MNLMTDRWLPVRRRDGSEEKIAPHEVTTQFDNNPIVELLAPRPDFKSALYQLLIGMFQVAVMPKDEDGWLELWDEPPSPKWLQEKLLVYQECFEIDTDGPAFMQDIGLPKVKKKSIHQLLIGSPGENTIKNNIDHFVKRSEHFVLDGYWAAIAAYALQLFGPPDGGGHREGLSGSGAVSTLLLPLNKSGYVLLWEKIWLNIFPKEEVITWGGDSQKSELQHIFPWMGNTRISTGDKITELDHLHPLSVYWGVPRRLRLDFERENNVRCSLTNELTRCYVKHFSMVKHGALYSNLWRYPFSSYKKDPEVVPDSNKRASMRMSPKVVAYSNWLPLSYGTNEFNPSRVVAYFATERSKIVENQVALWVSGYDMVPGKATVNNWYETTMPLFPLSTEDSEIVKNRVSILIGAASDAAQNLRSSVKLAWFKRPKDAKGNMSFLDTSFWQQTEAVFYQNLGRLVKAPADKNLVVEIATQWEGEIKRSARALFDSWALSAQEDGLNMKRVVKARTELEKWLRDGKQMKELQNLQTITE